MIIHPKKNQKRLPFPIFIYISLCLFLSIRQGSKLQKENRGRVEFRWKLYGEASRNAGGDSDLDSGRWLVFDENDEEVVKRGRDELREFITS